MYIKLYTDGGARGNPGPAAAGAVLENSSGDIIKETGLYLGEITNNQAEYKALILGLKTAISVGASELECILDSQLVVRQLNGDYKVKSANLKPLWNQAKKLEENFEKITYIHVKRHKNKDADRLVNEVLDEVEKNNNK